MERMRAVASQFRSFQTRMMGMGESTPFTTNRASSRKTQSPLLENLDTGSGRMAGLRELSSSRHGALRTAPGPCRLIFFSDDQRRRRNEEDPPRRPSRLS